jgi:tetratricopeptide (TPR) repeat protein
MKRSHFLLILFLTVALTAHVSAESGLGWRALSWEGLGSTGLGANERHVTDKLEAAFAMLQRNDALNPTGRVNIQPKAALLPPATLPGGLEGPVRGRLSLSVWEPAPQPEPSIVTVWFNEPYHLLGQPVLTDKQGEIYLLPPQVPAKGGRALRSRDAHPPGYEERYPSKSFFPLWDAGVAPFLRSVIRPTFSLAKRTVTTLFTKGNRSFWKPVSQERWILALKERAEAEIETFQDGIRAAADSEVTERQIAELRRYLQRFKKLIDEKAIIERHEKALEEARNLITMAEAMGSEMHRKVEADMQTKVFDGAEERLREALAAAAENRAEMEKYEQKLLQALLARDETWTEARDLIERKDWDSLEALGRRIEMDKIMFIADAGRTVSALENELAALSQTERKAAAWGFELPPWDPIGTHRHVVAMPFDPDRPSGLVAAGTKGARELVSVDPAFFTAAATPTDVLLLTITWYESSDVLYSAQNGPQRKKTDMPLLDALWDSLDWPMLRDLVD